MESVSLAYPHDGLILPHKSIVLIENIDFEQIGSLNLSEIPKDYQIRSMDFIDLIFLFIPIFLIEFYTRSRNYKAA